jgi:meso-butanediol dehydrogenase/(S,S)-butanediol dehydrogenase/diacetyl reductase
MKFHDQVCVITGAGSGIGRCMAVAFGKEGADVVAVDLDEGAAAETVSLVEAAGGKAVAYSADVSSSEDVQALFHRVSERRGRVDILCNNAGIGTAAKVHATTEADWDRIFAVNARGTFLGCKYAVPIMLAQGGGCIINTASVAGLVGVRERAAYCASKAAIIGLTRAMAVDYARDNIRVNALCPGTTETPWVARINEHLGDYEVVKEQMNARQLLGRMGRPEEIAAAAVYLASSDAGFVHGSCFIIDGGMTAQ